MAESKRNSNFSEEEITVMLDVWGSGAIQKLFEGPNDIT
jgi:hypothetical protein